MTKSRIIISIVLAISLALSFIGCGASGKQFTSFNVPKQGQGLLYVYRPDSMAGMARDYAVINKTDKTKIGILMNGGFLVSEMPIGNKELIIDSSSKWTQPITLLMNTEQTYPVVIKKNEVSCFAFGIGIAEQVSKKVCESEIKELRESK